MQVSGEGFRVESPVLAALIETRPGLRKILIRYAQSMHIQTCFTALSNALHGIEERLARWLLMCHDRTDGDEIEITHEFLSVMLAVRRSSVTTALHVLEGNRFIKSERGLITVINRPALEAYAHDTYGPPEREYQRLIGGMARVEASSR